MEQTTLYDKLDFSLFRKWKDKEEEQDDRFTVIVNDLKEELKDVLDEKSYSLLDSYALAIKDKLEYIYYYLNIKVFNYGIKIGMELEKTFNEFDREDE